MGLFDEPPRDFTLHFFWVSGNFGVGFLCLGDEWEPENMASFGLAEASLNFWLSSFLSFFWTWGVFWRLLGIVDGFSSVFHLLRTLLFFPIGDFFWNGGKLECMSSMR